MFGKTEVTFETTPKTLPLHPLHPIFVVITTT